MDAATFDELLTMVAWTTETVASFDVSYTVEPPNRGHFRTAAFVLSSEVVLFSEVI